MPITRNNLRACAAGAAFVLGAASASASVLTVGPGEMYKNPKAAAAAAHHGDTIEIFPGTYGGATWYPSDITIVGMGSGATITYNVQNNKGLFDIIGSDVTVENLTFMGAETSGGNGSGIRMEGNNLTVLNSKFIGNQDGILTGDYNTSSVVIKNSIFQKNGACINSCAHAVYVGAIASLDIENSHFWQTKRGHDIKSRALTNTITGNRIQDGPDGTSSYLIDIPDGGILTISDNYLEKGPKTSNKMYAISIGEEGVRKVEGPMLIDDNTYQNDSPMKGVFVRNETKYAGLVLQDNTLLGQKTTALQGAGTVVGATSNVAALTAPLEMAAANFDTEFGDAADAPTPRDAPEVPTLALVAAMLGLMWFRRRQAV